METLDTWEEAVRARTSVRSYLPEPVDEALLERLRAALAPEALPHRTSLRLDLVASRPGDSEALRGLGTYGFVRRPAGFLLGAAYPTPQALVDYGYALERAVLGATRLGLGTCWLGGSFTRSTFEARIDLRGGEVIPAVIAFGRPALRRGAVERVIRWSAGSHKRKPWEDLFFEGSLARPLRPEVAGPLAHPLEMLRLAPSASNKQPWRVVLAGGALHLYLARDPGYDRTMRVAGMADLHRVDAGIALCHLALTARERGLDGAWSLEDPDLEGLERLEHVATWVPQNR